MSKPLEYYFKDGSYVKFDKYTIDTSGIIRNDVTGKVLSTRKSGKYNAHTVLDNCGIPRGIRVCRALVSTFVGRPPTTKHTADHIDRNPENDTLDNIRWLCKLEQTNNRMMPESQKSAFDINKGGVEKTSKDWVNHFKDQKNPFGRDYTDTMINKYAQKNKFGFSYKEYPDLEGEVWKEIDGSNNDKGSRWNISNMCRVKYITKHAENVLSGDRLGLTGDGYPTIMINGNKWLCHILSFATFFPEEDGAKKINEIILHEDDDKQDFSPGKLRLGTRTQNGIDAHLNGSYNNKKSKRVACVSYIDGIFEKDHESQHDAMRYLISKGFEKASFKNISSVLCGRRKSAYGRTWLMEGLM